MSYQLPLSLIPPLSFITISRYHWTGLTGQFTCLR